MRILGFLWVMLASISSPALAQKCEFYGADELFMRVTFADADDPLRPAVPGRVNVVFDIDANGQKSNVRTSGYTVADAASRQTLDALGDAVIDRFVLLTQQAGLRNCRFTVAADTEVLSERNYAPESCAAQARWLTLNNPPEAVTGSITAQMSWNDRGDVVGLELFDREGERQITTVAAISSMLSQFKPGEAGMCERQYTLEAVYAQNRGTWRPGERQSPFPPDWEDLQPPRATCPAYLGARLQIEPELGLQQVASGARGWVSSTFDIEADGRITNVKNGDFVAPRNFRASMRRAVEQAVLPDDFPADLGRVTGCVIVEEFSILAGTID